MILKKANRQENDLLEMATRGERMGIEYLVNTYKDLAYTIAIKIVSNKEDAEEVVQDSFMKAFAGLRKFKRTSKFSTWLYRIVYNTALTKKGINAIRAVTLDDQLENEPYMLLETKEFDLLKSFERKRYVDLALSKLTHDDYLVISLYYMGEKSISEISEILGMKKSAIKMRLLRGRKQLQFELELLLKSELTNLL